MEVFNRQNLPIHRHVDLDNHSNRSRTPMLETDKAYSMWDRPWIRLAGLFSLLLIISSLAVCAVMGRTDTAKQLDAINIEAPAVSNALLQQTPVLRRLEDKVTLLQNGLTELRQSVDKITPGSNQQQQQQQSDKETTCVKAHVNSVVVVDPGTMAATPVRLQGVQQYVIFPKNDEFVGGDMMRKQEPFQAQTLLKMIEFIREGTTVLDIGGNLGSYTIWFAAKAGPKGRVWAFEPQTIMFQTICANAIINGHRNINPMHVALSFKEGIAHMGDKLPDGSSAHQSYKAIAADPSRPVNYGGRNLGQGGEAVRMTTLDSLNITNISFIKIDVQGAEPLVIYGARETIKREKPVVNFEVGIGFAVTQEMINDLEIPPDVARFDITAFLVSLDYRLVAVSVEDQFWAPKGYAGPGGSWENGVSSLAEWRTRPLRG